MSLQGSIGFIGGGQMGEALIKGIISADLAEAGRISVVEPDGARRDVLAKTYGVNVFEQSDRVWADCNIVILAVKPQIMGKVLIGCREKVNDSHLVISIAAGISIAFIEEKLAGAGCRVIRVMPNAPALVLEAATALSAGSGATVGDMDTAEKIFRAIGRTVILEEKYLDAVTGLSGSGPAYVFSFIEAMIDGGLKVGLDRETARTLVLQTILGSVKMAMVSCEHPAQLRAMVTSPGGTTIAGLHELEVAGFGGIIMDAVETATNRSKELGG